MTITTTRGRPGGAKPADGRQAGARQGGGRRAGARPVDAARRAGHPGRETGRLIDGANALQVGYADPLPSARTATRPVGPRVEPVRGRAESAPVSPAVGMSLPDAVPAPVALPRAPFLLSVVAVVVIGVLGVLLLNTKINENAFRLDSLRKEQAALDQQEQILTQQLAQREAPGELRAAAARLGLVPAGTPAFISLPDGRVVGVPQPAGGGAQPASAGR